MYLECCTGVLLILSLSGCDCLASGDQVYVVLMASHAPVNLRIGTCVDDSPADCSWPFETANENAEKSFTVTVVTGVDDRYSVCAVTQEHVRAEADNCTSASMHVDDMTPGQWTRFRWNLKFECEARSDADVADRSGDVYEANDSTDSSDYSGQ